MTHTVFVRDISLRCIVGVRPHERTRKQPVILNLSLSVDTPPGFARDDLELTVDYSSLHDRIVKLVEGSSCNLIETLAHLVAAESLSDPRVSSAEVTVEKPHALASAASAGVTVRLDRPSSSKETS